MSKKKKKKPNSAAKGKNTGKKEAQTRRRDIVLIAIAAVSLVAIILFVLNGMKQISLDPAQIDRIVAVLAGEGSEGMLLSKEITDRAEIDALIADLNGARVGAGVSQSKLDERSFTAFFFYSGENLMAMFGSTASGGEDCIFLSNRTYKIDYREGQSLMTHYRNSGGTESEITMDEYISMLTGQE